MDYAGKIWVAICGGFILIVGVLSVNGGLVWTDKIEQLEQAKTRVIDMKALPEQGVNNMNYCLVALLKTRNWLGCLCLFNMNGFYNVNFFQNNMATGTVKWFNPNKGFGFISQDEAGKDVFVHSNELNGVYINNGNNVEFDIFETEKGLSSQNIKKN